MLVYVDAQLIHHYPRIAIHFTATQYSAAHRYFVSQKYVLCYVKFLHYTWRLVNRNDSQRTCRSHRSNIYSTFIEEYHAAVSMQNSAGNFCESGFSAAAFAHDGDVFTASYTDTGVMQRFLSAGIFLTNILHSEYFRDHNNPSVLEEFIIYEYLYTSTMNHYE